MNRNPLARRNSRLFSIQNCLFGAVAAISAAALSPVVHAATYTWNNSGTDYNTAGDWTPGTVPTSSDIGAFSNAPLVNPNLSASASVLGLLFSYGSGGYTLSGNSGTVLTVLGSGLSTVGETSGSTLVSANVKIGATQTWIAGTGSTLTVSGVITNAGTDTFSFGTSGNTGTIILSGANTFAAASNNVNFGTVQLGSSTALGASTNGLFGAATGTLDLNGNSISVGNFGGSATITNTATTAATLTIAPTTVQTFSGNLTDGVNGGTMALVKSGTSDDYLYGTGDAYSGGTTIAGTGTLRSDHANGLGTGPVTFAGTGGTLLILSQSGSFSGSLGNNFVISGTGANNFYNNVGATITGNVSGSGALSITGNDGSTFSGTFTGTSSLTFDASANSTVSGNVGGFNGTFIADDGAAGTGRTTTFSNATAQSSASAAYIIGESSSTTANGISFTANAGTSTVPKANTIALGSLASENTQTGSLGFIQNSANYSTGTLQVGALNTSTTFAGAIQNGSGTSSITALEKVGTGTLTLTGANTYGGATTVTAGTLLINGTNSGFGAVNVNASTANGTAGTLGGIGSIAGATSVNAGGSITGGAVNTVGALTLKSTLILASGSTYLVDIGAGTTSDVLAIGGTLLSNGATISINSGTLDGTDTYTIATYASDQGSSFVLTNAPGYSLTDTGTALELMPVVPEPATYLGGLLLVGTVAWHLRGRVLRG